MAYRWHRVVHGFNHKLSAFELWRCLVQESAQDWWRDDLLALPDGLLVRIDMTNDTAGGLLWSEWAESPCPGLPCHALSAYALDLRSTSSLYGATAFTILSSIVSQVRPHTLITTPFLPSASSIWNPNTSLNKSFKKVYCPLLIIHLTLLATSTALAFIPSAGRLFPLRNAGSLSTRLRYAVSSVAWLGKLPKLPVARALTKFWSVAGPPLWGARENPTFMAALRMRIFRRVRLISSGAGEVMVAVDPVEPLE